MNYSKKTLKHLRDKKSKKEYKLYEHETDGVLTYTHLDDNGYIGRHFSCKDESKKIKSAKYSPRHLKQKYVGKHYRLYEIEFEPLTYSKDKKGRYAVDKKESKKMKSAKYLPKHINKVGKGPKRIKKNNKKKKRGLITAITSLALATVMAATGFFIYGKLKKKDLNGKSNGTGMSTSQKADELGTGSLDSLGEELPKNDKKSEYTKVSGDFDVNDVVRGSDGLLYDSQESANNASKSGTSEIDTKGGSLVVGNNGKVYTQEKGYEIVDSNGNVIESGNGTPSNSDEGIDYVSCPCNYYDDEGNLVHSTGELITPRELELCKQYYHTTKPKNDEYTVVEEKIIYDEDTKTEEKTTNESKEEIKSTSSEETAEVGSEQTVSESTDEYEEEVTVTNSDSGTFNADGTYTIYGVTYASYADYQQYIIDGGAGYGYVDGVVQPIGNYEIENQYTK